MNPRLTISVMLRDRSSPPFTLPPGVVWGQALHDYQPPEVWSETLGRWISDPPAAKYFREDLGYPVPRSISNPKDRLNDAKGFPQMVPGIPRVGVKLDKNLQWFWFKLLVWSKTGVELVETRESGRVITFEDDYNRNRAARKISPDMDIYLKNAWRGLTKSFTAFTNQRGTDNCTDYINGIIRKSETGKISLPMLWENTTGGALLRLESARLYRDSYKILALNPSEYETWRNWTPANHPGYFTDATNETPFGWDGKPTIRGPWRVDRFHYLGGAPVWVPIMSNTGFFYLLKNRVRLLRQGEAFPPRVTNP